VDLFHLFIVGGNPKGAAVIMLDSARQMWRKLAPKSLGELGKRKLCRRVIHDDDMAHAGCRCATADYVSLNDRDLHPIASKFPGAGGPDNARTDDDCVVVLSHDGMPRRDGFWASELSFASAVIQAGGGIFAWTIATGTSVLHSPAPVFSKYASIVITSIVSCLYMAK
jgi:hypothetical protein